MRITRNFSMALMAFAALQTSLAQNKLLVSGIVVDSATKRALPFVTLSLKRLLISTVTNEEGKFDLYIPEGSTADTLLISYFGYKHQLIPTHRIKTPVYIKLVPSAVELEEVIVRPQPPEYYIRLAMQRIGKNYAKGPFETTAYYREKVLENKQFVKCDEGVFKTYYPNYIDSVKNQTQLFLFRQAENSREVAFMSKERKKEEAKRKRRGEADEENLGIDLSSFAGPESILRTSNIGKKSEAFLDTLQLGSYSYSFAKSSSYNTDELIVIDFTSHGKVNFLKEAGKIYMDVHSLAIVKIESRGSFIIPLLVKPVIFFYGFGIGNPMYEKEIEFQQVNGRWYPKYIRNSIEIKLTNHNWFRANEYADFEIEQAFIVNKLVVENAKPVLVSKLFDPNKGMKEQAYNDEGISWEGLNMIRK